MKKKVQSVIGLCRFAALLAAMAVLCFAENSFELWTVFSMGYLILCELGRTVESKMK